MLRSHSLSRVMSAALIIPVLSLTACGGANWEERLQDPQVMDAYHQQARDTGTTLADERLDDMARRLCSGWAAGESEDAVGQREYMNTPILEQSNFFAIAAAARTHVCPST